MTSRLHVFIASLMDVDVLVVGDDSVADDFPKWDSQSEIELAIMLEQEYGITVDESDISSLRSVAGIRGLLTREGISDP